MANDIRISKTVLNKSDFSKVVDNTFKTFVTLDPTVNTDTVEEFFRLYGKLFYEIPIEGDTKSHTYLIQESSKLVSVDKDLTDIQPLLDEISELRERLLQVNQQMIELQVQNITNGA
tara:strand:- start:2593 stop:2943 length:351 start_codon:yes stop_codon:yes gene_type:complete